MKETDRGGAARAKAGPAEAGRAQVVYFSHGGGPLPILGDPSHAAMVEFMRRLPAKLQRPDAILVISAHWEERAATLTGAPRPPLFYDYYGFPEEAYRITYPAPGDPALAERIAALLTGQNVPVRIDETRGFDHGLFIPLKMMYPQADIPSVQLSLLASLDPDEHLALGQALRGLRDTNLLVVGSGFSFHNLRAFAGNAEDPRDPRNDQFQDWLIDAVTSSREPSASEELLRDWERAPSARYCHPREEHLLPLHVCVGLAGEPGTVIFDDFILGKRAVAFLWQGAKQGAETSLGGPQP